VHLTPHSFVGSTPLTFLSVAVDVLLGRPFGCRLLVRSTTWAVAITAVAVCTVLYTATLPLGVCIQHTLPNLWCFSQFYWFPAGFTRFWFVAVMTSCDLLPTGFRDDGVTRSRRPPPHLTPPTTTAFAGDSPALPTDTRCPIACVARSTQAVV